jgi:Mn2+/Fe2+ NRAMP family transporter
MSDNDNRLNQDRQMIQAAQKKGLGATFATFTKLSGPGWLQSAITLGGGSLASSLYLGVLAGYGMLWLQPFAMILGIIMLSCISFVTLSTGQRPFQAIRDHINPVLAWAWAIATLMANMVWSLPQFALANGVIQQNLAPELLGGDTGKWINCFFILVVTVAITWCYGNGSRGIQIYETILKLMVAMIVLSFVGVVFKMGFSEQGLPLSQIIAGFIPDLSRMNTPAAGFVPLLEAIPEGARAFWSDLIITKQRDVMISGAATAVGINMTFLMGYSLLAKGWDREFRGLTIFDLSTGMFIPFVLATSCVVIAASNQFHLKPAPGFLGETNDAGALIAPSGKATKDFNGLVNSRIKSTLTAAEKETATDAAALTALVQAKKNAGEISAAETRLAATLVNRDVRELALSLEPLTGKGFANLIFGVGVLGMALSTITILMLISGFVICEMFGLPRSGWPFKLGCLAASTGVLGPFLWGQAAAYLAVPTSVFGMVLLPIAYISFFLLINQKSLLKEHLPTGMARVVWNVLLFFAASVATAASLFVINQKVGTAGWIGVGILLALAIISHFTRKKPAAS